MSKQPNQNVAGADGADKQEQAGTFRLDALGASGTGSLIEAPPKKRLPVQFIVLGVLVVIAGGALYGMRQFGLGPLSAIAETPMDFDYEKAKGSASDHHKLLADLNASRVENQVPADQVQKNPFRLPDLGLTKEKDPVITKKPERDLEKEKAEKEAEERRQKIAAALASLKVHTVLNGSSPVARVGDVNVRIGDKVLDLFTVTHIEGRSVDLTVDGQTYTLSMDDDVPGGKGATKKPQRK